MQSLVVDHFHVTKLMNEKVDLLRRLIWHEEKDINKRKVIKGNTLVFTQKWKDIFDYSTQKQTGECLEPKPSADDCLIISKKILRKYGISVVSKKLKMCWMNG